MLIQCWFQKRKKNNFFSSLRKQKEKTSSFFFSFGALVSFFFFLSLSFSFPIVGVLNPRFLLIFFVCVFFCLFLQNNDHNCCDDGETPCSDEQAEARAVVQRAQRPCREVFHFVAAVALQVQVSRDGPHNDR